MNIKILDSWLREYLKTKASPQEIAEKLSLCGPSVERLEKLGKDWLYDIEITTNRVDCMSVYGIAREARAILAQFGIPADLTKITLEPEKFYPRKDLPLIIKPDKKLVFRTIGVVIEDIKNWETPYWMIERLNTSGVRSINLIVDITNYVMLEVGHPMHAFDYDKIPNATIIIRESKKGEKILTLEDKEYTLPGGDIIFQDINGEIIDLPGIIGTKNSSVSEKTKRVLFFVDNNDPQRIRKTSMSLGIRTLAATLNEKGVDPELGIIALLRALELAQKIAKARVASKIYDLYLKINEGKKIKVSYDFIEKRLGVKLSKEKISSILKSLDFGIKSNDNELIVKVPTFRAKDIEIPEDIVEEVARIYGYHNFPNNLVQGKTPDPFTDSPFEFEYKIKQILKGWGAIEVYTLSLVAKEDAGDQALKLTNPLGSDTEYLRTFLLPSLVKVVKQNAGEKDPFHIFEMANVYIPRKRGLPDEKMTLAGIFKGYSFRDAKGIIEALLEELNIEPKFVPRNDPKFLPNRRLEILFDKIHLGEFGVLENDNLIYYEFDTKNLQNLSKPFSFFKPLPKYPPQIEDVALTLPFRIKLGEVLSFIKSTSNLIARVDLWDVYKDTFTIRVWYQDPKKTLTNEEVEKVRKDLLRKLKEKYGVRVKNQELE